MQKRNLFTERVLNIVSNIKRGKTMTYKEVATRAGSPSASRAVGSIMKHNYKPGIPCHRVIRSDGVIGEYNRGGPSVKYKKLKAEGAVK
jgi:methylated-DNA-[protein]-cysteine S-methyltransferase